MLKLGFAPLEVILTLPLAAPLVVGEKSTVNEVLWPAFNVKGKASPLRLNPLPLAEAAEIVRLDPPELVSVSDALSLLRLHGLVMQFAYASAQHRSCFMLQRATRAYRRTRQASKAMHPIPRMALLTIA